MGKFIEIITNGYIEGVSEPWCNNEGIAVLPFVYKNNQYWFLLINEKNNLVKSKNVTYYGTLTGGCELNKTPLTTLKQEILEETGININNLAKTKIHVLGGYYANKTSIKIWHLYAVNISSLNLNLEKTYLGKGDGTIGEEGISGKFINENELEKVNDTLALAIYGKLCLYKIINFYQ